MSETLLRTLHINTERTWRGGEKQTLMLVEGLIKRQQIAELICPPGSPLAIRAKELGIVVHELKMRGEADIFAIRNIRKIMKQGQFDICQCHTSHAHTLAVVARCFSKAPKIIVARRVDFSIYRKGLLKANYIKYRFGVDRYFAISGAIKNVLVKDGLSPEVIAVVHSGVQDLPLAIHDRATLRSQHGLNDEHLVVGNVAHLASHKGQEFLIRAVAQLKDSHPQLRVLIIGDGERKDLLLAEIRSHNLEQVVQLVGFQQDVAGYLAALDIFTMPSIQEGLCTSILDALRAKLPVVASNTGGIPEIIEHEVTGLLATAGDASDLAKQLGRLADDMTLATSLAANGYDKVVEQFSIDTTIERSLNEYRALLNR